MFDLSSIADDVTRWTGLGVKLPKDLTKAIEVYEALRYTEVGYQPVFDIAAVTATNVEAKIREFADELALAETPAGGLSVLENAKKHAVNAAARNVVRYGREAVPEVIEQLTPEFDRRAEAYVTAVRKLPKDHDLAAGRNSTTTLAERLVAAGPEAVVSYQEAQREAQYLNMISSWVAGTGSLSGSAPRETYPAIRILRPATRLELIKLEEAHQKPAHPSVAVLNPVLV
jgi:hypothetical protein